MANHKSAAKRARQSERIAKVNSMRKSNARTAEKTLLKAIATKNPEEAQKLKQSLLAFTPSATFKQKRTMDEIDFYSGYVHLDFDKL
ncbi:MAG: 30S ribosomal protein S20, partial [Bdellovibrionales bacterium]|nr:30S ribosomal protein S20 [Bdellovibrionales bacterium]